MVLVNMYRCNTNSVGSYFCFIKTLLLFRAMQDSQRIVGDGTEISLKPLSPHTLSFPHHRHPQPEGCLCYNWWTSNDTSLSPQVHSYIMFTLCVVHSMGSEWKGGDSKSPRGTGNVEGKQSWRPGAGVGAWWLRFLAWLLRCWCY